MVKNPVKVYARLKNIDVINEATVYSIRKKENYDVLTLYKYAKQRNKYKFHQIFDQNSSQDDVFENTTKPIVNSVLHGFNGTIFAYGQTGSGKTYSMTGCTDEYSNRGIIPRCIQEIFQFTNKSPDQYTIFISYMEIYNEIGYDLLNPKHQATKLEELPRVILLDDGKGEAHLRNLFMLPVLTEQEAMRLLFLGDTNRTIAETPMNDYSSRSHCIFTIYITRTENERKIRKSKLNLVDLAGSERIYKTNISGTTLTEAKNINLSLHYLEQVILALSQSKRTHIPFRNSMMTYMLRDSLSGNSITAMLATISINASNLEETVTTCNFSQRVALVNTDAMINEVFDPQEEIDYLRNEVTNLRKKLSSPSNIPSTGHKVLSESEIEFCESFTRKYLETGVWNSCITLNLEQCIKCFQIFRNVIVKMEESMQRKQAAPILIDDHSCTKSDIVDKFKEIIKQKDEEIDILTHLLEAYDLSKNINTACSELPSNSMDKEFNLNQSDESEVEGSELTVNEEDLFEGFLNENNNNLQLKNLKAQIESKCQSAEQISAFVESCQQNILRLRRKLEMGYGITDSAYVTQIQNCLKSQQDVYAKSIENLKKIKEETDFFEHGLKQERIRLEQKFRSQRKEIENRYKITTNKSSADTGLLTRINESLKSIERQFSGKNKQHVKSLSPKKSDSDPVLHKRKENRLRENTHKGKLKTDIPYTDKKSNTNRCMTQKRPKKTITNSNSSEKFAYASDDQFIKPIKETDTIRSIKHNSTTAKTMLLPSNKLSDKWDALKKQQNELYSSYGDPPGNITRLMAPNTENKTCSKTDQYISDQSVDVNVSNEEIHSTIKPSERSDQISYLSIGIGLNKNLNQHLIDPCNAVYSNLSNFNKNDKIYPLVKCNAQEQKIMSTNEYVQSDTESDALFERKILSYLQTIPIDPRKDYQCETIPKNGKGDNNDNVSHPNLSESIRYMRNVSELNKNDNTCNDPSQIKNLEYLSIHQLKQFNRNINSNQNYHHNPPSLEENIEDTRNARVLKQTSINDQINDGKYEHSHTQRDFESFTKDQNPQLQNIQKNKIQMSDRYNGQAPFSEQIGRSHYNKDVANYSYNGIPQEEHIPEKDFTISHPNSSMNEKPQPHKRQEQHQNKSVVNTNIFNESDSPEFLEFMQTIPLTGDEDVDEEIVKFYRTKFTQQ